jgi:hypothetical protein
LQNKEEKKYHFKQIRFVLWNQLSLPVAQVLSVAM